MKHGIILLGLGVAILSTASAMANEKAQWYICDANVQNNLMSGKWNICDIAQKLSTEKPQTASEALTKLSVMLRAGLDRQAIETVRQLKKFQDDIADNYIESIYYSSGDKYGAWDVAQALLETFPEKLCGISLSGRLTKHMYQAGWSVEKIDGWMVEQQKKARKSDKSDALCDFYDKRGSEGWIVQRMQFLTTMGNEQPLVAELETEILKNPHNTVAMLDYLELLGNITPKRREQYNIANTINAYKPSSSPAANAVADALFHIEQTKAASKFYDLALKMPLTDKDAKWFSNQQQFFISADEWKNQFTQVD